MKRFVERVKRFEDVRLALGVSLVAGIPFFTAIGFLLATIIGADHTIDIQLPDVQRGIVGAGIGLLVGLVFFLLVAAIYPGLVEHDETHSSAAH